LPKTTTVTDEDINKICQYAETHFCDLKDKAIKPAKLTRSLAAFANAEGGELYVGIHEIEKTSNLREWQGFAREEDANGHVQAFDDMFRLGQECELEFLRHESKGLVLRVDIKKTKDIKKASDNTVYVRRGAHNRPLTTNEELEGLRRDKGITSHEAETIDVDPTLITNSEVTIGFMLSVVPQAEPDDWFKKQQLIVRDKPTVAGLVLFADEPQAALAKHCGIKIYRYTTREADGTRDTLAFDPISIEGCAYKQITTAVEKTVEIIQSVRIQTADGLVETRYPQRALHEIITNAVLHRDYSVADDIHIAIYDNRIEVRSPGTLAGHVTAQNFLKERFARNGNIVRLINKFPDPPNKDIGEGLNTAFDEMRKMQLKPPTLRQDGGSVVVSLRHESLASSQELILDYLKSHERIRNRDGQELCHIGSENKMKRILQRMVKDKLIEVVPGTTRYSRSYRMYSGQQPDLFPDDDDDEDEDEDDGKDDETTAEE
jgi:ATP-dependent DNA helicase RecG